jgi:DNA-binding transcriptional MerR regulator
MSEQPVFYTRGDIAKAKLVSATTVTNWDLRGLLTPAAITVGGIKLYTQASVEKLDELRGV